MRIVFMGTPDYSVPTLSKLISAGHTVAAVFCQPDKPVGRKQIQTPPPVKVFAEEKGIPVFQPSTLRDGAAYTMLQDLAPDIIIVVAYGKILPEEILYLPKFGAICGHASLLPKLRGASPIQWAIVTGETETGVTVMQMDAGIDTGDILSIEKTVISPDETAGELFDRLSVITADLIVKTVDDIEEGTICPIKQNDALATYAPIIKKEMAHIDFTESARVICRAVRGFCPWPVAFCYIGDKRLKVLKAKECGGFVGKSGEIVCCDGRLIVACGDNSAIEFLTVQPEGGRVMDAADMLKGHKLERGTVLC